MEERRARLRPSTVAVIVLVVVDAVVVLMLLAATGAVDRAAEGLDEDTREACLRAATAPDVDWRQRAGEESRYVGPNTIEFETWRDDPGGGDGDASRDDATQRVRCTLRHGGDDTSDPLEVVEAEVLP